MANSRKLIIALLVLIIAGVPVWSAEIHDAAREGDLDKIKSLLAKNPQLVSAKEGENNTPLHFAAEYGHKNVAEFLLSKGADVNAKENLGWCPSEKPYPDEKLKPRLMNFLIC